MKSIKKRGSCQKGYSLLEVLIALGILGISLSAIVQLLTDSERVDKIETLKSTQRMIGDKVALVLTNPQALANSLRRTNAGNIALRNCVIKGGTCGQIGKGSALGFFLSGPDDVNALLAGTPSVPRRYDTKGRTCASGLNCILRVQVEFWGVCELDRTLSPPSPRSTCTEPMDLMFRYKITSTYPAAKLPDYPPDTGDPLGGVFLMRRSVLATVVGQRCKPNEQQVGVDTKGNIMCECVVKETDANGQVKCGEQKCKVKGKFPEVMVGYDNNGKIICIDQNQCADAYTAVSNETPSNPATPAQKKLTELCPCQWIELTDANADRGQCAPGYWMVSLAWGQCWAVSDKSKGIDKVACDRREGLCCKLDAD